MSVVSIASTSRADGPRWLLLGSLALNLFFIGLAVAIYVRQPAPIDRSISTRIERLAAVLPGPDADILRRNYQANRGAVDAARSNYETARESVRTVLRREPFDAGAMRGAMTRTRAARQDFEELLQNVIVAATGEMSQAGRNQLADYGPQQTNKR
ncbi:MAG: periplasmic heavy metal sensor [Pseudolabrys sp.]|nr:periplasmic heavy metal sensor [Pseudolabrys sp.]